ncbi:MAG: hypothetical protein U0Q22_16970 [Acidimicrobiales bacterium]
MNVETPPDRPPDRQRGSAAGAWAAAAVVLAVGALVFGVLAHIRITDLEDRVAALEADGDTRTGTTPAATGFRENIGSTTIATPAAIGPADPVAARAAVVAAFGSVYDGTNGIEVRLRMIDDPTGVEQAIRSLQSGPNALAVNAATVNVNDVTFTSPTRASVIYGIAVSGQPAALGRTGEARVEAGAWKVTRATVCGDLAAAGGSCG